MHVRITIIVLRLVIARAGLTSIVPRIHILLLHRLFVDAKIMISSNNNKKARENYHLESLTLQNMNQREKRKKENHYQQRLFMKKICGTGRMNFLVSRMMNQ